LFGIFLVQSWYEASRGYAIGASSFDQVPLTGMKVLCVLSRHNYGDPRRGGGYEYTNFIPTLKRLGHEVHFLESRDRLCHRSFIELNRALLQQVEQVRPDVVLAVLTYYEIWLETWEILRESGLCATINWTTDDSWRYSQFSRWVAPSFHAFTTTYAECFTQYQRDGIHHVLLTQWAANADHLQPPLPASECRYPVTFVGTAHGKRKAWVEAAQRKGANTECFGHGWPNGSVTSEQIPQIIRQSVISLNFANGAWVWNGLRLVQKNQIKARTFEVPGAGGFLLTENAEGLDRFYQPGREVAVFADVDELVQQIRRYLSCPQERDAIAQAGFERTCREHTYDRRLAETLQFALTQKERFRTTRTGHPSGAIDWRRFEQVVKRHALNRPLKALRRLLLAGCSALWGPIRGPRAARRFLYEVSWRTVGRRTYCAAGWPGRLFYEAS